MHDFQSSIKDRLNVKLIKKYRCLPFREVDGVLHVYSDITPFLSKQELEVIANSEIQVEYIQTIDYNRYLASQYPHLSKGQSQSNSQSKTFITYSEKEDFIKKIIKEAEYLGSSDIHIEIYDKICRVRMRMNGRLQERYQIKIHEYASVINKIKLRAKLDIAEKRLPQDGRITFKEGQNDFDIRVSTLPTLYGEKAVLRLLTKNDELIQLDGLGLDKIQSEHYYEGIRHHSGIILISGPTGSGKTTTLYATLKHLNKTKTNILTIEDPIEYTLDGVNQVQLREDIGLNFGQALRTFLRQDPDIIMVGEIRDVDTANMAVRAALTGHLVLSTIHTNSAEGTVSRMIDMGIPSYLISSTLRLSVAQRLVGILCNACKEKKAFNSNLYPIGYKPKRNIRYAYEAPGCSACNFSGIEKRQALYEILPVNDIVSDDIKHGRKIKQAYSKLSDKAFEIFEDGKISFDEVFPLLLLE